MRKSMILAVSLATVSGLAACRQSETANDSGGDTKVALAARPTTLVAGTGQCDTPTTPFCDSTVPLPAGWTGHVFKLAQAFPATAPQEKFPWLAYDPVKQPQQYLKAALDYFYEGNIRPDVEASFDPTLNTTRAWYNAPWQDFGFNGREPIHGLTRERVSQPGELHPSQTKMWNNYAVGFYNAAGAATFGQVWADRGKPDPTKGVFPEGAMSGKLLFTTAGPDEVPYLAGAPTWNAYVYSQVNAAKPANQRAVVPVRLLQIDIAVKDKRAPLGWVFGTFVYGGGPGAKPGQGWANVAPVGVMWGNDPTYGGSGPLKDTWLNPAVKMPHVGFQGRLNGPVDNPASACMSCHMTAQTPGAPMFPAKFVNLPSGQILQPSTKPPAYSFDYSLQLSVGYQNFLTAQQLKAAPAGSPKRKSLQAQAVDTSSPRDGAPTH